MMRQFTVFTGLWTGEHVLLEHIPDYWDYIWGSSKVRRIWK